NRGLAGYRKARAVETTAGQVRYFPEGLTGQRGFIAYRADPISRISESHRSNSNPSCPCHLGVSLGEDPGRPNPKAREPLPAVGATRLPLATRSLHKGRP